MPDLMYDTFIILHQRTLNSEDINALISCYLPLMGMDSYVLYNIFSTLEENKEYSFKKILDLLHMSSMKQLTSSQEKLEGLGLLQVFNNQEKGYAYHMNSPYSIEQFLNEEVLYSLLESQIGKIEIEKMKSSCQHNLKGYNEITKKFDEVYEISTETQKSVIKDLINPSISFENHQFNYVLFKMLFDSSFLDEKVLEEKDFKETILKVSYVYKLDEEEMKDVVVKTINVDQRFDYPSLSKNAKIAFQKKYKTTTPRITTQKDDQYIASIHDDQLIALCNSLESMSPTDVLQELSGMKPSDAEVKLFADLINNTHLSISVINLMILIVNEEKDGELPNYAYFEKIANTWARAKLKTPLDVIHYLEKKKQKEVSPKTNKKVGPVPEWYEEYKKSLTNSSNDEQKSISEQNKETLNEMKKIAKNLFED